MHLPCLWRLCPLLVCCRSVTKLCPTLYDPMDCSTPGFLVLAQTLVHWVGDAIQTLHPLLFPSPPASIFPSIRLFASGSQSIGASVSASVLPMSIQGWFPLGLTGLISFQSKGLWVVFSSPTVRKHQFFSTQPSLWSTLTLTVNWITACTSGSFKGLFSLKSLHMKED